MVTGPFSCSWKFRSLATVPSGTAVSPQMNRVRQVLCTFASLLLLASRAGAAAEPIEVSQISIRTSSGDVGATVFEPRGNKQRPAIVVLHGAGGMIFDGPEMRRVSRHLAGEGNAVYMLHYFNSTGTVVAFDSSMQRHFGTWRRTVSDAVTEIQQLRRDLSPVGIYGYSLGGFLAFFTASDNPRVGAIVEHAGGVWNGKVDRIGKLPPVLMIHGERDARVPFDQYARPLVPVLRQRARKLETRFFPDEAHVFTPAAMNVVRADAARFFRRWLPRR
jgi:dienelactone hydrolase